MGIKADSPHELPDELTPELREQHPPPWKVWGGGISNGHADIVDANDNPVVALYVYDADELWTKLDRINKSSPAA